MLKTSGSVVSGSIGGAKMWTTPINYHRTLCEKHGFPAVPAGAVLPYNGTEDV